VIDLLDHARRTVADRPLWLFVVLLLIFALARRVARREGQPWSSGDAFARYASLIALIYYLGLAVWYATVPQQVDYAEPTMTAVAWLFRLDQPVYHAIDSAARYSHMYGPLAFAVPGVVLWLLGPSMFVAKAIGVTSALIALGLMWMTIRHATRDTWIAILACGLCVLEFLMFRNLSFWSRPEPLQLVAVAIGLCAAARLSPVPAVLAMSVSMGLLWNLKITGPLYSLPIFVLLWTRTSVATVALSAVGAFIVAALPFVALPNVSFHDYLLWVRLSAQNGLRVAALKENIEWAVFVLVPVLVRLSNPAPLPGGIRAVVSALILGLLGVIVAASKPGGGAHHLVPFLPVIAYVYAASVRLKPDTTGLELRTLGSWLAPFVATLLLIVFMQQEYFIRLATDRALAGSYDDVAEYLATHPGERVGMGYTSAEAMTFARTLVVFKTGEYLLDAPAMQEHQLSGLAVPQATIDAIRGCSMQTWLLPRGTPPFHLGNDYPQTGYAEIFPPAFIDAFHQHYVLQGQTLYYDVWRCRRGRS
jgi:hypothetical protein